MRSVWKCIHVASYIYHVFWDSYKTLQKCNPSILLVSNWHGSISPSEILTLRCLTSSLEIIWYVHINVAWIWTFSLYIFPTHWKFLTNFCDFRNFGSCWKSLTMSVSLTISSNRSVFLKRGTGSMYSQATISSLWNLTKLSRMDSTQLWLLMRERLR